jgi:hypothetical protein
MMKMDEEDCHVLDLNRGGIRFLHQKPLKFDSRISLQLFTPAEQIPLGIEGRVRWSVANAGMSYKYQSGVQFNAYGPERTQNPTHFAGQAHRPRTKGRHTRLRRVLSFVRPAASSCRPTATHHS